MSKYEKLWKYISTQEENFLTLTFAQIEQIAGLPIDHSFLKYKAELLEYGWAVKKIHMKEQTVDFTEAWDAYDANFQKLKGTVLLRTNKVPDGMFHLVVSVILKHTDGTYLLMQRDLQKSNGGKWDFTAIGSAKIGESADQAAKRELAEETGITCTELCEIDRAVRNEFHMIIIDYFGTTDCDKSSVVLQKGETVAYKWITREELEKLDTTELQSTFERDLVIKKGL